MVLAYQQTLQEPNIISLKLSLVKVWHVTEIIEKNRHHAIVKTFVWKQAFVMHLRMHMLKNKTSNL